MHSAMCSAALRAIPVHPERLPTLRLRQSIRSIHDCRFAILGSSDYPYWRSAGLTVCATGSLLVCVYRLGAANEVVLDPC